MVLGFCNLCRRDNVELQESHYMPAALYPKKIRLEYISRTGIRPLAGEITQCFLCSDCEQRFSEYGESEVLRHIAGKIADKPSPLVPKLERLTLREEDPTLKSYCGADAGLDMDMFAYFALSMAWRATHSWPVPGGDETKPLSLGLFKEPIRQFLVRETGEFPNDTAVTVIVCTDKVSREAWYLPSQADELWTHDVKFLAFGVQFRVTCGKSMHPLVRRDSCHTNGKLIHLANCEVETAEALAIFRECEHDAICGPGRNLHLRQ